MGPDCKSLGPHMSSYDLVRRSKVTQDTGQAIHSVNEESKNPQPLAGTTQYMPSVLNHIDLKGHKISIHLQSNPRAEMELELHFQISQTLSYLYSYLIWAYACVCARVHVRVLNLEPYFLWKISEHSSLIF